MFFERIFENVQFEILVEIPEEGFPVFIRFADDNGVFVAQVANIGKCRAEHRMRGDKSPAGSLVILINAVFYRRDVREHAIRRKKRNRGVKRLDCIFQRHRIDKQFRLKRLDFRQFQKPGDIDKIFQLFRIGIENRNVMIVTYDRLYQEATL